MEEGVTPSLTSPNESFSKRLSLRILAALPGRASDKPNPVHPARLSKNAGGEAWTRLPAEPLPQITGQLPGFLSLLLAWAHQGQQEASPISAFNWGFFLVSHLPDFLQQTALNSWVPPSSRGGVLRGGRREGARWVPSEGSPRRPKGHRCGHCMGGGGALVEDVLFTGFCY